MTSNRNDNPSPFPSASDMYLDMWRASDYISKDNSRLIDGTAGDHVCKVYGMAHSDGERDATARRIDMLGDIYEALRMLTQRAKAAGIDVSAAEELMTEFVAPKPFGEE